MSNLKKSNIPFLSLGKENLMLLTDMLEKEEIGEMMISIYQYVYEGIEPDFKTKAMKSVWNNMLATMERKASGYFGRKEHMDKVNSQKKNTNKETYISSKETIQEDKETALDVLKNTIPSEFDIKPLPAYAETRSLQIDFVTDEQKYGPEVMNFLDKYSKELHTALRAAVDFYQFGEEDKRFAAESANVKINELARICNIQDTSKLEKYCADFRDEYIKTKNNQ